MPAFKFRLKLRDIALARRLQVRGLVEGHASVEDPLQQGAGHKHKKGSEHIVLCEVLLSLVTSCRVRSDQHQIITACTLIPSGVSSLSGCGGAVSTFDWISYT